MVKAITIQLFITMALTLLLSGGGHAQIPELRTGKWRGVFEINAAEVPFQLEIKKQSGGYSVVSVNGARRDQFETRSLGKDSLLISLNSFESALFVKVVSPVLIRGEYRTFDQGPDGKRYPLTLEYGKNHRFVDPEKAKTPKANLTGRWVLKILNRDNAADRVAVFEQTGNHLNGIILSQTKPIRKS